jgi:hypothetical protein
VGDDPAFGADEDDLLARGRMPLVDALTAG